MASTTRAASEPITQSVVLVTTKERLDVKAGPDGLKVTVGGRQVQKGDLLVAEDGQLQKIVGFRSRSTNLRELFHTRRANPLDVARYLLVERRWPIAI
ncbi:hypothetical protein [Gloeobacter kilaueensis]|uniref:Uncharacterized protein n=1 Tax=Gloeobacter kilaueensis (strain ATCC BAA-2537 / CCAP 1431/1 / ULC 316 / JS1) TaxID=1183438 RepID=U5QH79_GLOK1|nr:hypothetical protein [Gloeobacter kilaueensis]AGY58253.1 hypothetical protein GKIL_2007 [Gloeobacter kilaueensis JS1]